MRSLSHAATVAARKAAEEAGRDGNRAARAASFTGISLQEAQQILNVKDLDDMEAIRKVWPLSLHTIVELLYKDTPEMRTLP